MSIFFFVPPKMLHLAIRLYTIIIENTVQWIELIMCIGVCKSVLVFLRFAIFCELFKFMKFI